VSEQSTTMLAATLGMGKKDAEYAWRRRGVVS
jgi:hypothetical protein